jgi:IS30 family transposase
VYFCDPHSPWQRGTNENTNALLRQYFPEGEPIGGHSQAELNAVARELNGRPRKTLAFRPPLEALTQLLQRPVPSARHAFCRTRSWPGSGSLPELTDSSSVPEIDSGVPPA